ncbi:hypothetical protein [Phenylobacterium sp.]|jgi:hypothetical protein|uniref:hypothetical protein n=1 Tax=Phenylobacterium sp. TaxID=1871053 RepID=UPI002E345569|nr:hypothetical protein [Phenylobacterium sp.]HEX3365208.1 hypothetical protein [Phenylobacterium sp.]
MADPTTAWTAGGIIGLVAGSSVIASVVTLSATWVRDLLGWNARRKFAALYLAIALEQYARTTATLLGESETHDDSNGAAGTAHSNFAALPEYPGVDWEAFGIKRAEAAMGLRTEVDSQRSWISGYWEFAEEEEVVPEMQERAAKLGLKAFEMAEGFRKDFGLTPLDQSDEWSTKKDLARKHEKFVARRLKYEERQRAANAEMFDALQQPAPDLPAA